MLGSEGTKTWYEGCIYVEIIIMQIELSLNAMTIGEKVQLLEQVWDNLCQQSGDVRSPDWHFAILEERRRQIENGAMAVSSWSEAKERLQKLGK